MSIQRNKQNSNYKEFPYTDENGIPLYKKVIKEIIRNYEYRIYPKNNSWERGRTDNVPNVLYNTVIVNAQIKNNNKIYWVQDELSADALKQLGIVATTVIGGKYGKITDNIKEQLKGVDIVILKSNSRLGETYSKRIKKELGQVAKSIKIIDLTEKFTTMNWVSINDLINLVQNDTDIKRKIRCLEKYTSPAVSNQEIQKEKLQVNNIICIDSVLSKIRLIQNK